MEQVLGSGLRGLNGIVGGAALGRGLIVGASELRYAHLRSRAVPTLLASLVAAVVALRGAVLLRGAWRARVAVRSPPPDRG